MNQYFIVIYEGKHNAEPKVREILRLFSTEKMLEWMQENKGKSFAIYNGVCVLDYS